jgi:hypothetical protein
MPPCTFPCSKNSITQFECSGDGYTSKSAARMASTSRKCTAVLRDEELEYLLQCESEQSLSDSDFDTENELEDRALLDTVINEDSDEDYSAMQDFVWENMENYKGQKENFMGSVGPQGAAKLVTEIVDIF